MGWFRVAFVFLCGAVLGALVVARILARPLPSAQAQGGTRWEYKTVYDGYREDAADLNALGRQGWEAYAATKSASAPGNVFLKRRLP